MPVCAFIQEPVNRLSRNLVRSTGILVARHSLSFILHGGHYQKTEPEPPIEKMTRFGRKSICSLVSLQCTLTPNFSFISLLVRPWSPIEVFEDSAGGGVGGSRGKKGRAGRALARRRRGMPVCAFIREPIDRLSRNLACSTSILAASQSLNFIPLA